MAKDKFLLINLNENKTKKIAEIITSDTSRKILDYLAEKEDTEQRIAETLQIPLSTAHYHLQKLVEGGLVVVEEFHYSKKGREINHYKLANKYIIITPKPVFGIKQKLMNILPVALIIIGITGIIKITTRYLVNNLDSSSGRILEKAAYAAPTVADQASFLAEKNISQTTTPDIALWFLIGGLTSLIIYIIIIWLRDKLSKK